jgi:ribose transport system substrate-binding protein
MKPIGEESHEHRRRGGGLLLALFAVILVAIVAAGCGSSSSSSTSSGGSDTASGESEEAAGGGESGKHVSLAMFLVATANTHQQAALKGAEKAVEEDGNASLHAYNGNFDPSTQSNQIEDATASGQYDALLVDSIDGTQTVPAITKALDEEMVVICGFSICGPNQEEFSKQLPVTAQIASDYFTVGEAAGKALGKGCKEKGFNPCNVVYLDGTPTLALDIVFQAGVEKAFEEFPEIKIVAEAEAEFLAGPSYKAMKTIIQAHPEINGVVSVGDQEISGALQAIEESPLKDKGVILVGDGASEIGTKGVESGVWYASSILRPYHEGYLEAQYAMAAVRGEEISPDLVNSAIAPGFPDGYIEKSNVAKWKPEWAG